VYTTIYLNYGNNTPNIFFLLHIVPYLAFVGGAIQPLGTIIKGFCTRIKFEFF